MKIFKRILVVAVLLTVAVVASKIGDKATGWQPPPPRAIPAGATLVQGAIAPTKEKAAELGFDMLKKWTYIEGKTPIPEFIRAFDGKTVKMTGYMMPLSDIKEIKSFVLVPSLFGCCYGQPPAVNHVIVVKMAGDTKAKFFDDVIQVRGTFHSGEEKQDGYLVSLYHIDADSVVAQ
jgi:hypothetical protein